MAANYTQSESANPLLDGQLCDQIHAATQEIQRRLSVTTHRIDDLAYFSRVHPNTIRMIRSGKRPVAAPETLDALVIALDRMDAEGEE